MSILKPIENGRMYKGWWRWNPIAGCKFSCDYCYMRAMSKRFNKDMTTPVFHEDYLKDSLDSCDKLFVCSSGDMWGDWVSNENIARVLAHCAEYDNEYMFLTKNPMRYMSFDQLNDLNCIIGATIETDQNVISRSVSEAMPVVERLREMAIARSWFPDKEIVISVEPIMKFSPDFVALIKSVKPDIVYIGADSGNNGLSEPSSAEIQELIDGLKDFTDVRLKSGLKRLLEVN